MPSNELRFKWNIAALLLLLGGWPLACTTAPPPPPPGPPSPTANEALDKSFDLNPLLHPDVSTDNQAALEKALSPLYEHQDLDKTRAELKDIIPIMKPDLLKQAA